MDTGLDQRTVLVTGSSSGIGRETALAFGQEGANVGITYYSNEEGAKQTASLVEDAGGEALTLQYDLGDSDSIHAAVERVVEEWGSINVLVNNAVEHNPGETPKFEDVPREEWRQTLRTTQEGYYETIQAVLSSMRSADFGRIVSISSNTAEIGTPGMGPYAMSKASLHGLSNVLSVELADAGILSNIVMPGLTLTEQNRDEIPPKVQDQEAEQTPTGRLTTADEVASMIVYLGSQANGHVNGEIVRVTGGR